MTDRNSAGPTPPRAANEPHDLFIVSDLHMGRGKNSATGRYFGLEAFFYDDDFRRFCRFLCDQADHTKRPFKLLINGDALDFLRIEPDEVNAHGPRYGPILTPATAEELTAKILRGHPKFVEGLAHVLARGHHVIFLPGNHDIEMQWECVQAQVRAALLRPLSAAADSDSSVDPEAAIGRLEFRQWFYYEPGRIWLEHGCQYDPENSFRYLLRQNLAHVPDTVHLGEQDLPLGNFFQRYLYNDFGHITFIVPSARASTRYIRWLLTNEPRLLAHVIFSHLPFVFRILRRFAGAIDVESAETLRQNHERELAVMCRTSGLGERLRDIDALKEKRADVLQAVRTIGWQLLRGLSITTALALLSAGLWFMGFLSISQLAGTLGLKTLMFLVLNFIALGGAFGVLGYLALRQEPPAPLPHRRAARQIARIVGVPIVVFGHTHDEVVWPIPGGWYYNTGTWIAVFTHDVLLPRERVQYTFLRVRGTEPELLHWSPGRGEALPVILLDDVTPYATTRGVQPVAATTTGEFSRAATTTGEFSRAAIITGDFSRANIGTPEPPRPRAAPITSPPPDTVPVTPAAAPPGEPAPPDPAVEVNGPTAGA